MYTMMIIGYYVAAGTSIRVDVLNREGAHGWSVRIGCHDDELDVS